MRRWDSWALQTNARYASVQRQIIRLILSRSWCTLCMGANRSPAIELALGARSIFGSLQERRSRYKPVSKWHACERQFRLKKAMICFRWSQSSWQLYIIGVRHNRYDHTFISCSNEPAPNPPLFIAMSDLLSPQTSKLPADESLSSAICERVEASEPLNQYPTMSPTRWIR